MNLKLYKDGDQMAIQTDARDESEFTHAFVALLADMIENKKYEHDWEFQLGFWLPQYVEICCKYRGYKTSVEERRVLIAGSSILTLPLVAEISDRGVSYPNNS